jgi:IS30 family transposase
MPGLFIVRKINDKTAASMHDAPVKSLGRLPADMGKSAVYDHAPGTKSYFCKPCHRREKGGIEVLGGILRRYFPQKHKWRLTARKKIDTVVSGINATPVKCLGFKTPAEVFATCGGVALAG